MHSAGNVRATSREISPTVFSLLTTRELSLSWRVATGSWYFCAISLSMACAWRIWKSSEKKIANFSQLTMLNKSTLEDAGNYKWQGERHGNSGWFQLKSRCRQKPRKWKTFPFKKLRSLLDFELSRTRDRVLSLFIALVKVRQGGCIASCWYSAPSQSTVKWERLATGEAPG